ncbi:MAG: hypothetical protein AB1546_11910 [bacterium]
MPDMFPYILKILFSIIFISAACFILFYGLEEILTFLSRSWTHLHKRLHEEPELATRILRRSLFYVLFVASTVFLLGFIPHYLVHRLIADTSIFKFSTFILRIFFHTLAIFTLNLILLLGIRDILYFILPIGPSTIKRLREFSSVQILSPWFLWKIAFWAIFFYSFVSMSFYIPIYVIFIFICYFVFKAAEKIKLYPGALAFPASLSLLFTVLLLIKSQPVLLTDNGRFSVDLWLYNAINSFLEVFTVAAEKLNLNAAAIDRIALMVPWIQNHIYSLLFLSLFLFSTLFLKHLMKLILIETDYAVPDFYEMPPPKWFFFVAAAIVILGALSQNTSAAFIIVGIYYLWGVTLLLFFLRGNWLLYCILVAVGILSPVLIATFAVAGVIDNLIDVRRIALLLRGRMNTEL